MCVCVCVCAEAGLSDLYVPHNDHYTYVAVALHVRIMIIVGFKNIVLITQ